MTISVKPIYPNELADDPALAAAGYTTPSEFNAGSTIEMATARLLGRFTALAGPAEEIAILAGLLLGATGLGIDKASDANLRASAADKVLTADRIETASALVPLADAATIVIDWDTFIVAEVTVAANRAFGNPTNVQPGTTRFVVVKGSDATARTVSFGTNYKGDLPTGTVTSTSWLLVGLTGITTSHVVVTSCKAL